MPFAPECCQQLFCEVRELMISLTRGTAVDLQTQSPMGSEQEGNESGCVCWTPRAPHPAPLHARVSTPRTHTVDTFYPNIFMYVFFYLNLIKNERIVLRNAQRLEMACDFNVCLLRLRTTRVRT